MRKLVAMSTYLPQGSDIHDFQYPIDIKKFCDKFKQLHSRKMTNSILVADSKCLASYIIFHHVIKFKVGVTCHPIHPPGSAHDDTFRGVGLISEGEVLVIFFFIFISYILFCSIH